MTDDLDLDIDIELEAYCVTCKAKTVIEEPEPVWTSRGRPGTRGQCSVCGGNVFRMGRTELHGNTKAPEAIQVVPDNVKSRNKNVKAVFIAASVTEAELAKKLADELQKAGIYIWLDNGDEVDKTRWASGVHPALEQCTHLIIVLSSFSLKTASVEEAWQYFLKEKKPILLAQMETVEPPDRLRSRPRFDFAADYKAAFRGLMAILSR